MFSYRRETALQGLLWPKVEDWNWEYHRSAFTHCSIIGPAKLSNLVKKNAR